MKDSEINKLSSEINDFVVERDWVKFHTPKNLAISLNLEASEVLEIFQWLTDNESQCLTPDKVEMLSDELADVFVYLIRIADIHDIDLYDATIKKLEKNRAKYPTEIVKGSAKKYNEYS